ncbi:MAG TPA: cohesin domain-containing protein [Candidatus Saccharimonadales bacterium]|nr:cohesin domain-containing protein [Candidatus Saccharimonadales bacterium]
MVHKKRKIIKAKFTSTPIKIFIGIIALLLIIVVPLSVYLGNQQTQLNSNAAASTTLSFSQSAIQVAAGSPISASITMNPGSNAVSLIQLVITYDSSMVTPNATTGFQPNATAFPTILDGPTYGNCNGNQCTMSISMSIGNNVTQAITQSTTIGTVNFQPVKEGTTQLFFDPTTQIFSIAAADQANENVLSSSTPTTITIGQASATTPTAFPLATTTPTQAQATTDTPTLTQAPTSLTPGASTTTTPTTSGTTTPTPTGGSSGSNGKICSQDTNKQCGYASSCSKNGEQCEYSAGCHNGQSNNNIYVCKNGKWTYDHWVSDGNCKFCSGNNTCGNDTTEQQKAKIESLREINETLKEIKFASYLPQNSTGKDKGGCVGSFDPNNPNKISNCNQSGTAASNIFQDAWNNFMKLFSGQ